ncbi:2-keto-4-methylthiobutyrate aminotransferase [Rubrobacter xylanophilus]|uniref:2-keto-4-methylthiobutyrate aminotransferase n=1 Tax=Rubrobacter xylanophilus TaxID=49319 RepID=A0A510HHQ5_9ACTN|nr:aminotransferase class IV [Rubrobacter xylanophilus]BBL78183.1 2-keto-4-methylthiobutyrate aminotransferase [Rubrobacter xylanophilus]
MSGGATSSLVWIDGRLLAPGEAGLDPRDRGYALGDGLFETMLCREGGVPLLARHLARMRRGAEVLGMHLPPETELAGAVARTVKANGLQDGAVRLTVSRGVPEVRGLLPTGRERATVVVQAHPYAYPEELYRRGMEAITCGIRRNERSPLARIKSLSYLENVLARREAAVRGADEAILLNTADMLAGASAANVFLVRGGGLITPEVDAGALPGVARGVVLELAGRLGLEVEERPVEPGELAAAEGCFLTNALMGIMPVRRVDGRAVGGGEARELVARLRKEWERFLSGRDPGSPSSVR